MVLWWAGFRIRIHFIRIQHFFLIADPDPGSGTWIRNPDPDPGFNDLKLKKIQLKKNNFFLDKKLQFTFP